MTSPYSITIETENEKGTKEFEEEIFGKMKDMMQSITKDSFKEPIITFHISYSNGNSFVVWRKETINKQGMFTKHILCYKKTREEAEFSKQRYELKHKKALEELERLNKFKKLKKIKEIKTEKKPINIKFKTNDGKNVSFKAVKIVKKKYKK
jgi:hypothetical protein